MDIRLVQSIEHFRELRLEWNDLLSKTEADTIFLTWEWLYSWWESYARSNDTLHIITVRDHRAELIGIFPLYRERRPWLPGKRVATLRFIGDGSYDSDYLDAILAGEREEEILEAVWAWLGRQRSMWCLLQLAGIPETSPTCRWLKRISSQSAVVSQIEDVTCLVTDLPNSWEQYLSSLKPRFRTKIRHTLRELTAESGFRFYRIESATDLKAGLETLFELHGKRWELKGTNGVFANPEKRRFYERFTSLFLDRGWLTFDVLEVNGRRVACQMCFTYRGGQFLLQEGFDPEFASESVGIGLRALVLKRAIEEGVRQYDFLAGVGRHKMQWNAHVKYCRSISLGYRTVQNVVYLRAPVLMQSIRERVKTMLPVKVLEIRRRLAAS